MVFLDAVLHMTGTAVFVPLSLSENARKTSMIEKYNAHILFYRQIEAFKEETKRRRKGYHRK